MAETKKRYYIKTVGNNSIGDIGRALEKNLMRLSTIGIEWNENLIRNMRGIGVAENTSALASSLNTYNHGSNNGNDYFNKTASIVGQNDYIAYYDQNYEQRRKFLRDFSMQGEIEFVTNTIADDAIVYDDNNYFAYPNTKVLYSHLKKEVGKEIIDNLNICFKKVYNAWKFNESSDAWHYMNKFLVDGILAFEIIYDTNASGTMATDIIAFHELDVLDLEPDVQKDDNGNDIKVWYQKKGSERRIIPDANMIYISWSKANFIQRISYVEHLVRSFNMLRTLENSRIIWNIQNAQKQLKIVVPMGTSNEIKMRDRLNQLKAEYKEDVTIDNLSGEITVNGQPKFNFQKTFLFPSNETGTTDISEIPVQGHDLSNIEQLKFFYQKFILESKVPSSRFGHLLGNGTIAGIPGSAEVQNREEYSYSLFINRVRNIFKELLIKPTWNLFCIKYPQFNSNTILRSLIGLKYVEDNIYTLTKMRQNAEAGAQVISSLASIQNMDGTPYFSMKFLTEKYLGLSDEDYKLNEKYLNQDKEKLANSQAAQGGAAGADFGAGGDFGGGADFGGPDLGGGADFGGGDDLGGAADMSGGEIEDSFGSDFSADTSMPSAENDLE